MLLTIPTRTKTGLQQTNRQHATNWVNSQLVKKKKKKRWTEKDF